MRAGRQAPSVIAGGYACAHKIPLSAHRLKRSESKKCLKYRKEITPHKQRDPNVLSINQLEAKRNQLNTCKSFAASTSPTHNVSVPFTTEPKTSPTQNVLGPFATVLKLSSTFNTPHSKLTPLIHPLEQAPLKMNQPPSLPQTSPTKKISVPVATLNKPRPK